MDRHGDTDASLSDKSIPTQQPQNTSEKLATLDVQPSNKPISANRPMLPFAADATHEPEDPLRNKDEKYDSDSEAQLGDVSDVQNPRPSGDAPARKLTTTQAVIIFVTNEVGIGMLVSSLGPCISVH
jgi:hypothetical protein